MLRELRPFQDAVLAWYRAHRRALPWRGETDPYRILLSEVLLQQTRVEQAIPYYHRFLEAFPTLQALAEAPEEAVLKAWEGAGYYARARNLKRLAEATPHGLPRTYRELLALPGVGPYTAAAVASIAFGEPVAAVDGNVRRVLARLFAVPEPRPAWLRETAQALLAREAAGEWNQALMELGATVCTPRAPRCAACPAARWCRGRATPERYPAPKPRTARSVPAAALVLAGRAGYVLERRDGKSLGGLWGFPLAEGEAALERLQARYGVRAARRVGTVRHAFTHKKLTVAVWYARTAQAGEDPHARPLSKLDRKILALLERLPEPPAL
ncbi:A/G-specific adenine glycosylase [Marinithermus hydrothermalis]|uniref:Adenine DNA glycosylase n=1 Tax=Marinithermus hydrothermalis (strain DSM 14884 / JCM 11576 / T1) TaxID=869210 RepID=F2NND0_MARHT|nr:A/G-specific adenine glycosylase [Marinithermus hydrothermalis]AEB10971.1 A/G-specific adenine glycosylase [Marinithermus hydrothermalis DSM 14884]